MIHISHFKKTSILSSILITLILFGCSVNYSFSGINLHPDTKTVQIDFFPNNAPLVEPTLSQQFTLALQDRFLTQTNLDLVKSGGDIHFEGEIIQYRQTPTASTTTEIASQERLTIGIKVRYYNSLKEEDDFDKTFSHFFDYPANQLLTGSQLDAAYEEIFERITQDIFNASVAKW